jgi:hypothetical protein
MPIQYGRTVALSFCHTSTYYSVGSLRRAFERKPECKIIHFLKKKTFVEISQPKQGCYVILLKMFLIILCYLLLNKTGTELTLSGKNFTLAYQL